jgi:hypothetical protein
MNAHSKLKDVLRVIQPKSLQGRKLPSKYQLQCCLSLHRYCVWLIAQQPDVFDPDVFTCNRPMNKPEYADQFNEIVEGCLVPGDDKKKLGININININTYTYIVRL